MLFLGAVKVSKSCAHTHTGLQTIIIAFGFSLVEWGVYSVYTYTHTLTGGCLYAHLNFEQWSVRLAQSFRLRTTGTFVGILYSGMETDRAAHKSDRLRNGASACMA